MSKLKLFLLAILVAGSSHANTIEFTVHHGPGGPSDKATRTIAQQLPKDYVVVNRPGAQGKIAIKHVLNNDSLIVATMSQIFVTNMLTPDPSYNDSDLELIGVVGAMPSVLVCNKKHQFNKYEDFLQHKGSLNFGVAGYGSSEHLSTEILLKQYNNAHQVIPYAQGGSTSLIDLLSGNIDCMFANYPLVAGHLQDNRLNVLLSSHRISTQIPTWKSFYKEDFPIQSLLGVVVSKNLNPKVKQKIVEDINLAFSQPTMLDSITNIGLFPILGTNKKIIDDALNNNTRTKQFILKHKLKLN